MKRLSLSLVAAVAIVTLGLGLRAYLGAGAIGADPAEAVVVAPAAEQGAAPASGDGAAAASGSRDPGAAIGGSDAAEARAEPAREPAAEEPGAARERPARDADRSGAAEQPVRDPASGRQADAESILRSASGAYEGVRSLRADFVMELRNPLLRQTTTSRGTLYQRDPDRLLLQFSDPDGDVIVSDGQHLWVYYPSVNRQQVIRTAPGGGAGGLDLRSHFVGDPLQRFEAKLEGSESVGGRAAHVLVLVPRQRGAGYASLKVWIDRGDHLVRRFEITEENGSVRRFDLSGLQVNPQLSDDLFRFSPPAGARVVDR